MLSLTETEANASSSGWELMRFSVDFNSFKADEVVFRMLDAASFCKVQSIIVIPYVFIQLIKIIVL